MKFRIIQAEFDALHEEVKKLYKKDGDTYKLTLADEDDPVELKRGKDREAQEARDQKKRADDLQKEFDRYKEANKAGDVNTLQRSWEDKERTYKADGAAKEARLTKLLNDAVMESRARAIATNLSGENADAILPHVMGRLEVDITGEKPVVRVKDAQGKPSAASFDDLEKEFVANKIFSGIILASRASGGATGRNNEGGGGADKAFKDMNEAERTALYRSDPGKFKQLSDAHKAANRRF